MLVCSISQRGRRAAIAADLIEAAAAVDANTIGNIIFATLVDDPASVGEIVDAYLGEIMVEAATATDVVAGSLPAVLSADILEAAAADSIQSVAGSPPNILTGLIGWWDASVTASLSLTGSSINSVADQSGAGNTMVNSQYAKPQYNATGFNGKPAFMFDAAGAAPSFSVATFAMGTGNTLTMWFVGRYDSSLQHATGSDTARVLSYTASGRANDYDNVASWSLARKTASLTALQFSRNSGVVAPSDIPFTADANHRVIVTVSSSGVITAYADGIANTPVTVSGNWISPGYLQMGKNMQAGKFWSGPIGECGVATGYSDATTVAQLDTYLKNKWGL